MGLISRARGWLARALSPDMQSWVQGMDIPDSEQGAKLVSPYMQSTWIYTAVSVMAEALAQIPFRISRVGEEKARRVRGLRGSGDPRHREYVRRELGENILDSGPAVELFERPHPTMDKTLFWAQMTSWDALRGEAFIMPLDEADQPVNMDGRAPRVARMLTLTPELFWHMVTGYTLEGWRYTGSPLLTPIASQVLLPGEIVHCRNVNPYLYWRGLSPLVVAQLPGASDYAAAMFMKGLLMNNADTGVIATTEQNLTMEQREQFVAALRERKRKAGTPDRPLFLSSGVKIEKPTISNVDMQFLETRRLLRQEIGAIFKVPESIMGFSESKASSLSGGGGALNEEKLTFIVNNIGAKCHRYEAAVAPIVRSFGAGLVGWFDIEGLPIMQEARRTRVDSATKMFALGVPFNDINRTYDLGFPEYPWGETGYLPFNLQPADAMGVEEPGEDETAPRPGGSDGSDVSEGEAENPMASMRRLLAAVHSQEPIADSQARGASTAALWRRHMRARETTVRLFSRKVSKVLNEYRGKTLAKLAELHLEKGEGGRPRAEIQERGLVDLIFNAGEFGTALKVVLEPGMRSTLQGAGNEARREVGESDPWAMPPKFVSQYIQKRSQAVMGVGGTVRDRLNTSLDEGYDAGETMTDLAGRVKGVFGDLTSGEAMRVARTETNIAFNAARHESLGAVGIEYKAWLSSHGPAVRPGHAAAEAAYIDDPIPLDEPFVVDMDGEAERLMYPGDDSLGASVGNIINCQCVQLAAERQEEDEKGAWFKVFGVGRMYFGKAESGKQKAEMRHCCAGDCR